MPVKAFVIVIKVEKLYIPTEDNYENIIKYVSRWKINHPERDVNYVSLPVLKILNDEFLALCFTIHYIIF